MCCPRSSRGTGLGALPPGVPPAVVRSSALPRKGPRKRLRDIGEARLSSRPRRQRGGRESSRRNHRDLPIEDRTVRLLVDSATLRCRRWSSGFSPRVRSPSATRTVTRFDVQPPDPDAALTLMFRPAVALSANGSAVAFVAASGGVDRVYVRVARTSARVIPGSERGTGPVVSPDGKWVAFFADGVIRKAAIDGEASPSGTLATCAACRGRTRERWS